MGQSRTLNDTDSPSFVVGEKLLRVREIWEPLWFVRPLYKNLAGLFRQLTQISGGSGTSCFTFAILALGTIKSTVPIA